MRTVTVLCVGKCREGYVREFCAEYEKRLAAYCRLQTVELPAEKLPENPSGAQIAKGLEREGAQLLARIPKNAFVFALCIEGKMFSSEAFSQKLSALALDGKSDLVFVLGSSFGLSDAVKRRADCRLSISEMTFPHRLARVMLLEQLYRAFQIEAGGKYHK
ncbi:MAG TPA: 23S rRNA (pseudouridine(1915)-N(3))-methyltransferase RlmH [Candidatus Fimenecus excrementigallinarum]|uniref:Ribosomal RNA large subunit methyltransferase H n=1 Tax=Candidatus Fimenecus excrementigallinarum TaxID=2840816 RepID=A0A9D1IFS0_9FIRM|nr:23S rRNA (pseudouridine(1915)-N(3))-methyltransferase RlmH [Candidatus Fimenecus excrementigallinarum]